MEKSLPIMKHLTRAILLLWFSMVLLAAGPIRSEVLPGNNTGDGPKSPESVIVGTSTETNVNTPIYPWYGYSFTQTLYFQSELNFEGKVINQIGYQYAGPNNNVQFEIEVYLTHTTLTEITSTIQLTGFTKVYDGPCTCNAGEEFTTFEITPFYYNNTDNLIVTILEKKPGWNNSNDVFYSTPVSSGSLCIGQWNDGTAYDPNNLPSSYQIGYRANTKFFMDDVPTGPPVSEITPLSLNFGDVETGQNKVMTVSIKNTGADPLEITGFSTTNDQFTVINTTFPLVMGMNESENVQVQYLPSATGYTNGVVTFVMDPSIAGDKEVTVSGKGLFLQSIIIGTDATLSSNTPIYPWYGYSFTQTIYFQPEINMAGRTLNRIGYQYGGSNPNLDFMIEIYLGHTSLTSITQSVPLSGFTKVYDGPYIVHAGEEFSYMEIDPFFYNNTDNLLITIIEKKPGYTSSSDQFYATNVPSGENWCVGAWNDGAAYDPNALPSGSVVGQRANTKLWFSGDVPTEPEAKTTPAELYFGEVETSVSKILTVDVMNVGGGILEITGATLPNPAFSVINVTFPVSLTIGQKKTFEIQFLPTVPGLEEALLTFNMDAGIPGTKTVALSGRALRFGVLREGFEGTLFPPLGWKVIDNNMDGKGWLRNTGFVPTGQTGPRTGVGCASLDVYAGSPGDIGYDDWLITPQMIWQDGDVFKFYVKRVANQSGQTWRVCLSTSGTDVGDFVPIDEFTDPPLAYQEKIYDLSEFGLFGGDLFYIGIQFNSLWCWPGVIDDVLGPVMNRFDNDLLTLGMTGADIVYVNAPTNYQVQIGNFGSTTVAGTAYTVDLIAYAGGIETVFGSVAGQNLAPGEIANLNISALFPQIGTLDLFAKIDWDLDENPTNNISPILTVEVLSPSVVVRNIGDFPIDNETDYYNQYPINFADIWRTTSLSECMYLQYELNTGGIIERLTYYKNFTESMNNRKIKVWMGTTDSYSLNNNYIPPSELKLVFDGKVSFAEGMGKADIELTDPFVYTGNGNLVINVYYYDGSSYSEGATFAYTEDYSYYRTSYETGWSTINPENPTYIGTTTNYPNTTLMFETGNGLGQLHGYVYYQADNTPVDDAKIEIYNPNFPGSTAEIFSDASGYYTAPYAMAGTNLTVTISKFGYSDVVYENVNLPNGGSVYLGNAYLVTRPLIAMLGTVYKSDTYEPARFATVKLTGMENYETTTEVMGEFLFENIWGLTTYQIEITLDGYQTYHAEIDVPGENYLLDPIILLENAPAPNLVNAVEQDENALVTWYASGQPYPMEFRYDDGIVDGVLITPGTPTLFTGSVWFNHAIINSVHFYNYEHENYPPSPQVRVIFLGLTAQGAPDPSNQLAIFEDVRNDYGWNTFNLPSPVEAPEGFFVGIAGYSNYTTISYDDGVGEPYEWQPRTQWGNGLGNYNPLENGTSPPLHGNILVRASGLVYGDVSKSNLPVSKATTVEITDEKLLSICVDTESFDTGSPIVKVPYIPGVQPKSFQHYNVYRKALEETGWTAVSTAPVTDTSYVDETWSGLGFGLYLYGVEAEYTNGVKSVMAESNIIEKNMRIDLNLTVLTNTGVPGMSEGALVKLSNQNGNINYVYYGTVGADETVIIPQVLKGIYDLEISKPGFQDYSELGIDLYVEGLTFEKTVTILEYIYDPYDLEVETNGQLAGNALFQWNQSPVFDNVDSYEPFLISNIGEWTVVDQDAKPTVTINGITFPHTGEPFAFITLNRSLTTPPLSEAYWSGHSGNQYFAGFASAEGNTSNWLISPGQNHSLPFTMSFWAKGVNEAYGAETFRVAYSTTGMNLSDFVYITGDVPTTIFWTQFAYTIPAEAKYVAIRHTHTGFALLVDDILLGVEADNSIPANGFSIYLDGSEIETGLMAPNYTFQGVLPGTHIAGVKSHFYTGESGISETEFVMPSGTMLNFQVQDDKGVLLDGAVIRLLYNGSEVFTTLSVAGFASIGVTPGTWQYEVTFGDLVPVSGEVVVTGEEEDLLVVLNHYYTLTFSVTDEGGHPVNGAIVVFKYQPQTTGIEGTVSFISEPGVYPYAVNHPDFNRVLASVNLTDNQTESVVLTELECEAPTNLAFSQYFNIIQLTWEPPVQGSNGEWLHWDGENTGNSIGTGGLVDFDVAQRFEPSDLAAHNGKFLTRVVFLPREEFCTYSIRVWVGGNIAAPEMMVVDQVVVNPVIGEWNEIVLSAPVYVDATKELWFGVRNNTTTGFPAGCDDGPAVNGKGNLINLAGQGWITLLEANASLNYNWNVRGILEEMDGMSPFELVSLKDGERGSFSGDLKVVNNGNSKGFEEPKWFLGYNVYRNDVQLNENLLDVLYFDDVQLPLGTYTYDVTAVYTNGCESANTVNVVVDERLGQQIPLYQGWQAISTYQVPDYPNLPEFFRHQVANQSLQIVLGKSGIFWPGQNINTLGNWDTHQGYKLKMNANDLLNVGGEMVEDKTVQVAKGISYLPVLSETSVPADEIFDQITGKLTYAFDIRLGYIYWPAGGLYTLQYLEPGVGYLLSMTSGGSVTFPDSKGQTGQPVTQPSGKVNSPWTIQKSDVGHIVSVYRNALDNLQMGDFIGAFNRKGDCVGFVMYDGNDSNLGLVVYGDDFTTGLTDGMLENESISFRIYNAAEMTETVVTPVWDDRMPQSGFFAENGLSAIKDFKLGTFGIGEQTRLTAQIYPNPAGDHLFVEISHASTAVLVITDQIGQTMLQLNLKQNNERLDLSSLQPGVYMVRITSDNVQPFCEKLIVK